MSRVLALLGAVALIVVAVVVRAVVLDDDGPADDEGRELVVVCIPELADACNQLGGATDVVVERPDQTIARLADGDDLDAWVTFDPWPAMAELVEDRATLGPVTAVAGAELVAVVRVDSSPAASCPAPADWACLVEAAPERVAIPELDAASGPLVLGWAAAGWSAATRPGEPFARAELDLPAFQAWADDLETFDDPVGEALVVGPAGPLAIGTTAVDAARIDGTREDGRLVPLTIATPATLAVVVAGPEAARVAADAGLTAALADAGWNVDPSAATTGLPNPGVLVALREAR